MDVSNSLTSGCKAFKCNANANPGFALAVYMNVVSARSIYLGLISLNKSVILGRCLSQEHLKQNITGDAHDKRFHKRAEVNRPNRGHFTTGRAGNAARDLVPLTTWSTFT